MTIVFYSTNSDIFNKDTYLIKTFPSWTDLWNIFINQNSKNDFFCVSQLPSLFLPENNTIICNEDDTKLFANKILELQPDLVIALSFWQTNFDWLNIKDSLIAQELQKNGIKVICNNLDTCLTCFDKSLTHNFLQKNGFLKANAFFVDHSLYFCGANKKEIKYNVYKEAVINELSKMKFPLIAKNPLSLSSYGMDKLNNKNEVINYLNSKKNNSNRLFEEFLNGTNFGVEIYSHKINKKSFFYNILPPFVFSTNKYGITSPKQSVKYGPVYLSKKNNNQLKKIIKKLIYSLQLEGICQIDLILSNNKWYIVEINPRLSGMTSTYFSSLNKIFYELLYENFVLNKSYKKNNFLPTINIKFPILSQDDYKLMSVQKGVKFINQINNLEAKQEREKGFCEVIITGKNKKELEKNLVNLKENFSLIMEEDFFNTAIKLINSKY